MAASFDDTRSHPEKTIDALFSGTGATQEPETGLGSTTVMPADMHSSHRYEVGKVIAKGGMGAILNAREATLDRVVAMKVMLNAESPEALARFVTEAKITGGLEHPNVVPVHELGVDDQSQTYYTMKMVHGVTLRKVLEDMAKNDSETTAKYPLASLLTIFQKVCDAMAFAHSKGIIHRDLKPENIMLGDFGEVLVMDWGLAKTLNPQTQAQDVPARPTGKIELSEHESGTQATMEGTILGTLRYMAPEQAKGWIDRLDVRSDIYSLGAILYHILTLRTAVEGSNTNAILVKVCTGKFVSPAEVVSARTKLPHLPGGRLPASLSAVAMKAMALEQANRYTSVTELQRDIAAYQNGFATSAENASLVKQTRLLIKRNKGIFATVFAAWLVITALVAWFVVKVTYERNRATANEARAVANESRAEAALADLRSAAPTLMGQARELIDQQKFDDALQKIDFAVKIDGNNAGYHLLRAQFLEAMLKLDEAAAEFRSVLALGPNDSAAANLALCEKVLRDNQGHAELLEPGLKALHEMLIRERRTTQDVPIATRLGLGRTAADARIKALFDTLRKLPGWDKVPENGRFSHESDGTVMLNLAWLPLSDLSVLKGLPISNLNLRDTKVEDLSPLRGMPLKTISLVACRNVEDLSPLAGMPLQVCDFEGVQATDFSPLKKCPIKELTLISTHVTTLDAFTGIPCERLVAYRALSLVDISAVRTMRLRYVDIGASTNIQDLAPLADCPDLEYLYVPSEAKNVASLRRLAKLRCIGTGGWNNSSPEEFWLKLGIGDDRDREHIAWLQKARTAMAACGIENPSSHTEKGEVKVLPDGTLDLLMDSRKFNTLEPLRGLPVSVLYMGFTGITELSPLADMPLRRLDMHNTLVSDLSPLAKCHKLEVLICSNCPVHDLAPLAGLPLVEFDANDSSFSNIAPLAGMPLKVVILNGTGVSDIRPLFSCPTLEWLTIPTGARDIGQLHSLKKLVRLSDRWDDNVQSPFHYAGPAQTAEEFWKEYDAKKAAGGKN